MALCHAQFLIDGLGGGVLFIDIKANLGNAFGFGKVKHFVVHCFVNSATAMFREYIYTLYPPIPTAVPVAPLASYHQAPAGIGRLFNCSL